ncbi:hypothetical protein JMJ35_000271 [Cladonia borealis]|uniref:Uncharacterized protein n=1 Tax=Cladonia borealis TaxID=184061 RepID=A0AA39RB43_9LECA|nr:hypothetical protein JMJ35_000271 [Cladonia borealis]
MAPAVLAGSLATIIELADNPPERLPQSATQLVQQPLTLYIARVPGSRDVFLTTIKPQEKVVTASDVQSSLYYVHVDSPEDYKLLESSDPEEDEPLADAKSYPTLNKQTSVRRKALPRNPNPTQGHRPEPPPRVYQHTQAHNNNAVNGNFQVGRKPIGAVKEPATSGWEQVPALPERKVLGPRPMNQQDYTSHTPALQNVPARQNIDLRRWSEQPAVTPPRLPPRTYSQIGNGTPAVRLMENRHPQLQTMAEDQYSTEHGWEWEKKWQDQRMSDDISGNDGLSYIDSQPTENVGDGSLSLIRRYNGEQWNVGKISNTNARSAAEGIANPGAGISVAILTPGYAKFSDREASISGMQSNLEISHGPSSLLGSKSDASSSSHEDQAAFRRHLRLSGHMKRPDQRRRQESTNSMFMQEARPSFDSGIGSQHSDGPSSPAILASEQDTPSLKRFVLQSPWDGTCEFSAGIAGRSLKCKHSYRSTDPRYGPSMHSATVSELRFNLPSSKAFGSPNPKSSIPGTPREAKRSSIFSSHRKKNSSSSLQTPNATSLSEANGYFGSKIELEDRLDLALGQEHAGGGFGGKQAKLGKLIIENEGLLMLDLVVAANMALWWRVYEKVM